MSRTRPASTDLDRLRLDEIDWSRCSGRDLHRLAEGAAQAAMRRKLVGSEGKGFFRNIKT